MGKDTDEFNKFEETDKSIDEINKLNIGELGLNEKEILFSRLINKRHELMREYEKKETNLGELMRASGADETQIKIAEEELEAIAFELERINNEIDSLVSTGESEK